MVWLCFHLSTAGNCYSQLRLLATWHFANQFRGVCGILTLTPHRGFSIRRMVWLSSWPLSSSPANACKPLHPSTLLLNNLSFVFTILKQNDFVKNTFLGITESNKDNKVWFCRSFTNIDWAKNSVQHLKSLFRNSVLWSVDCKAQITNINALVRLPLII